MEPMIEKRPQADRLLVAELYGEARHHAKCRDLTAAEEGAAVTAYRGDRSWRAAVDDVRRVQVELLIELGRLAERTLA